MQCSRTISLAQATYSKCLRTTDCNLVCSLEQESHTAPFMLSIHSPDNIFMVLVSIFISNRNHFCVLCFRVSCSARNHNFMTYRNIEHNSLKTYVRKVVQRRLYVSALWCRDKNYMSYWRFYFYSEVCSESIFATWVSTKIIAIFGKLSTKVAKLGNWYITKGYGHRHCH